MRSCLIFFVANTHPFDLKFVAFRPKFSGDSYVEFQEKTILGEFFENFVQTKAIYLLPKLVKFCPTLCNFYSGSILQKVERNFTSFGRG